MSRGRRLLFSFDKARFQRELGSVRDYYLTTDDKSLIEQVVVEMANYVRSEREIVVHDLPQMWATFGIYVHIGEDVFLHQANFYGVRPSLLTWVIDVVHNCFRQGNLFHATLIRDVPNSRLWVRITSNEHYSTYFRR